MEVILNTNYLKETGLSEENIAKMELLIGVNIFGVTVPSTKLIELILNQWKHKKNSQKLIALNNQFILDCQTTFDPERFIDRCENPKIKKILQIYLDLYINYKHQCEIADLSFVLVWRSLVIMRWFHFMLGNTRNSGSKEVGDELSRIINARTNQKPYSSSSNLGLKDRPLLDKYPEYAEAKLHFITFLTITNLVSDNDSEMEKLKIASFRIAKRLTNLAKHSRINYHSFICPICQEDVNILYSGKDFEHCGTPDCDFCNTLIILPKGRELARCESDYCRKKYSSGTTEKHRSQPHAINEKKKRSSEKVTTQWIKVDNTARWCVGVCSKRRLVDKHQICEKCHDEGFGFYG